MCCDRDLEILGVSNNTTGTLEQIKTNSWTPVGICLLFVKILQATKNGVYAENNQLQKTYPCKSDP